MIRNADAFAATRPAKAAINAVPFDKVDKAVRVAVTNFFELVLKYLRLELLSKLLQAVCR